MNLYSDVYQLLRLNDCVIIPNFGGFVTNYFEAKIDLPTQEFYPPAKRVAFNQSLNNNDGLLINFISSSKGIDWNLAELEVKSFVEEINNTLKNSGELKFYNLGIFTLKNNILVFKPDMNLNLLEDSFGLKNFNFPMIQSAKKGIEIQKPKELSKTKSAKHNKKQRSIKPVIFYLTSAAVITGLLLVSIHFDWIRLENNPKHQVANIAPVELVDTSSENNTKDITVHETVNIEENTVDNVNNAEAITIEENATKPEEAIVEETTVEETIIPVTNNNLNIHIIAGSFGEKTNALNYQSDLKDMGYDSQILPSNSGMYRVSVKSFAENSEATAELSSLRNATGNQSLWVLNW
jgi:cell division protein FtsN